MIEACRGCVEKVTQVQVAQIKRQVFDLCARPETRDVVRNCPLDASFRPGLEFFVSYERPVKTMIGNGRKKITIEHPEVYRAEIIYRHDSERFSGRTLEIVDGVASCREWNGQAIKVKVRDGGNASGDVEPDIIESEHGIRILSSTVVPATLATLNDFSKLLAESSVLGVADFED